jgi:hypothetical protein
MNQFVKDRNAPNVNSLLLRVSASRRFKIRLLQSCKPICNSEG